MQTVAVDAELIRAYVDRRYLEPRTPLEQYRCLERMFACATTLRASREGIGAVLESMEDTWLSLSPAERDLLTRQGIAPPAHVRR